MEVMIHQRLELAGSPHSAVSFPARYVFHADHPREGGQRSGAQTSLRYRLPFSALDPAPRSTCTQPRQNINRTQLLP